MWRETYHRFASRAAFLAVCDAACWARDPLASSMPVPPTGVAVDEIGPLVAAPTLATDGAPVPGDVLDARHHVNLAWSTGEVAEAFDASRIAPATPSRTFGIAPPPSPPPPQVPAVIPAWKGKAWLHGAGKLAAADAAAEAVGGVPLLAWRGAAEWHRTSTLMATLAQGLGLTAEQIDAAFVAADAIKG